MDHKVVNLDNLAFDELGKVTFDYSSVMYV